MKAHFNETRISAVIGVVPATVSYFDDELVNYTHDKLSSLKLKEVMGYGEHRIENSGRTTADFARFGFAELVKRSLIDSNEVDALFFVSQTPDYVMPPTSSVLHGQLDLPQGVYCVDINDGCNGYLKGLFEAFSFLNSTQGKCAVLIAGDILSPYVSRRDRNSFPLIGDAVTITVIRRNQIWVNDAFSVAIDNNGKNFDKLIIPAGGARQPICGNEIDELDNEGNWRSARNLRMNGRDVFAFTQTVVPQFIEKFCTDQGCAASDFDRIYLHQANLFIIDRLRKKLGVTQQKMPDHVIRKYGNSSSGTIPMLIASEQKLEQSFSCLLSGFGVGLSWGVASVKLYPGVSQGVLEII
jgi:3-oxoacyl-[acyl-carrier-protein] synthase-3